MILSKDSGWVKLIVDELKAGLGADSGYLVNLIPKLGLILDCKAHPTDLADTSSGNEQRTHYLLCRLIEIISTNSVSLTLCFDDVQWIDDSSISFLTRLLTRGYNKFFFVGCYREGEMIGTHPFLKMLETVRAAGVNITEVHMTCIGQDALNEAVSNLLCLPPRLVLSLSNAVHKQTKGNPLFISQTLLTFYRDGLLYLDFARKRFEWDEGKISRSELPDNIALYFTNDIVKLPIEIQLSLHTLSMFGGSARVEHIQYLEQELNVNVVGPLKTAEKEGLVSIVGESVHFNHDKIQEASYAMIGEQDRHHNHITYGKCLISRRYALLNLFISVYSYPNCLIIICLSSLNTGDDDLLFAAVNQINLGRTSAASLDEYFDFADYNMKAGKRSMELSDFISSFKFLDQGISFLSKIDRHWINHYNFSIEIYELGAKAAVSSGNIQCFQVFADQVLQHSQW